MSDIASLSSAQCEDLCAVAAAMIPASEEYRVPGGDDPAIQADIVASLGRDLVLVRWALDALRQRAGQPLEALDPARREALAQELRTTDAAALAALSRVILQCYYRDDRVVLSLGLEPRPPYPKGHVLEDGDWSLLDPVRARPPLWRRV